MKNKKGYTLVELIVVFALTAVFITAATMTTGVFMRIFLKVNTMSHAQTVASTLMETLDSQLSSAAAASAWDLEGAGPSDPNVFLYISADGEKVSYVDKNHIPVIICVIDGMLHLEYQPIEGGDAVDWYYGEGSYSGNRISSLAFEQPENDNLLKISLTLKNTKTGYEYAAVRWVECYNLGSAEIKKLS